MKIFILASFLILSSCGPTTTGNPVTAPVTVRMEDQQAFALIKKAWDSIIPSAFSTVSNVKFCFKRLRFKPDSNTSGSDFDVNLGEVDINPNGTNLLTVAVPIGTYRRIEFDLENECDGTPDTPSVTVTNLNGTFTTLDHVTIKFEGSYTVSQSGTLSLDVDSLFDALDTIASGNDIKTVLEAETTIGDF